MLVTTAQPLFAQDYSEIISEDVLRELFVFEEDATLKYSSCEKITYPSCTYIWGEPSKRDATRESLKPEGNRLLVIFAQATGLKDFETSTSVYPDPETVEGLGVPSIWSPIRQQLSLMTDGNLIVHVNIEDENNENPKATAIAVAMRVLEGL
jgi:hypothetical protein